MPKISRWRAGIKEGNRRERDVTDGSFNEEFIITGSPTSVNETVGNWRFINKDTSILTDNLDALGFERYEDAEWKARADVSESIDTDDIEITQRAKGMRYTRIPDVSHRMLSTSTEVEGDVIIGNPLTNTQIYSAGVPIWLMPEGFYWIDQTPGASDVRNLTSYEVEVSTTFDGFYKDQRYIFNTAGVPYRVTIIHSNGTVLYESQSDYSWLKGEEKFITVVGVNELITPDTFNINKDSVISYKWEFKSPVDVVGIEDFRGSGLFVPAASFFYSENNIVYPVSRKQLGCSEWASVDLLDPSPQTLHGVTLEYLVDPNCIPILFEN